MLNAKGVELNDWKGHAAADDCEVGAGKKACKNCTCGRADAEAAVQKVDLSQDMIDNPQSACGSVSTP